MPKDNENIPFLDDAPLAPSEPQGFAPDQMVRCEECLRSNPPTRVTCFYCAAALPFKKSVADLRKPSLRPIENWAQGYNNIFLPHPANDPATEILNDAAVLLKLDSKDLSKLVAAGVPVPLARTATLEEATLVDSKLKALGLETTIVSDKDLALKQSPPVRVRALQIDEIGLTPKHLGEGNESRIPWNEILLLVTGRFSIKRVERKERKGGRGENEILEANEFFSDDVAADLYCETENANFRILANGFDFSCLREKRLVAAENFSLLLDLIRGKAPRSEFDNSYNSCRQALDAVWPSEQQSGSRGWHRERPGKYTIGAVTETSNEVQFTRYSRLRHFLKVNAAA